MTVDLVIFDCDGVLVDSERITAGIWAEMLRELGLEVTVEDVFDQLVGKSMDQCLMIVAARWRGVVPQDFVANYRRRSVAALMANVKPVPGIEAVLASLTVPYCVASNGTHEKMQSTLGICGLLGHFSGRIFSVSDVARGKPAPDLFLHAADRCGVDPGRCAVVEDTPVGVTAGVAAGMRVFGFCALTPRHRLIEAGAQATFERMELLPDLLAAL